ncbi:MAG TPA: hypothetical protein VMI92_11560 [Steroidobacteraceae bacterium]|nr:hypothetical protein [Steroidobacteraceae bacterium]
MTPLNLLRRHARWLGLAWFGSGALIATPAFANCTVSPSSGSEPTLQSTLDSLLGPDTVPVSSCIADGADSLWTTVNQVGAIQIQIELAGNAASNSFGIYDPNTNLLVPIFSGSDGAGDIATIIVTPNGSQWTVRTWDANSPMSSYTVSTSAFGFYLQTTQNGGTTLYSDSSRNVGGADYMYAWGPLAGNSAGQYIIAWEDSVGGDGDYQDFVAQLIDVQPVNPVPLPASVWLLASGLLLTRRWWTREPAVTRRQ